MRTRKTVIILISGKAGSGKTTLAEFLVKKLQDIPSMTIFRYAFANPIKYIAKAYAGWDGEKDYRGRRLLQKIGLIFREYDDSIWVKHFVNQLDKNAGMFPFNFAVVDDWRFPNELAYLTQNPLISLVTIRVFGRGGLNGEMASDVSENSLPEASTEYLGYYDVNKDKFGYDFAVENSESLERLESKVDVILSEITKQYIVE